MKRTRLQLDEDTYQLVHTRALGLGISVAAMIQEILHQYFKAPDKSTPSLKDFTFIGSGSSAPTNLDPVSERHDEALEQDSTI